jgi:hypothetical protein
VPMFCVDAPLWFVSYVIGPARSLGMQHENRKF